MKESRIEDRVIEKMKKNYYRQRYNWIDDETMIKEAITLTEEAILEDIRQMINHEKIKEILIVVINDMHSDFNPHKDDLIKLATGISNILKQLLEGKQ